MLAQVLLRLSVALFSCAALAAQTGGVAQVVNRFGTHQSGNTFTRKDGVYLGGGPLG